MTDVITSTNNYEAASSVKRRNDSFHSSNSLDLAPPTNGRGTAMSQVTAGGTSVNADGVEVHDAGTATPGIKHNFSAQTDSPPSNASSTPRFEAFVMTGEKILNLNPKISPNYAKVQRSQLPPNVQVDHKPNYPRAFENFPSVAYQNRRKRSQNQSSTGEVSASNSESLLHNTLSERFNSSAATDMNEPCASSNEITSHSINPQCSSSTVNRANSLTRESRLDSITRDQRLNSLSSRDPDAAKSLNSAVGSENNVSSSVVADISQLRPLQPFPDTFNYTGLRIDAALRHFLENVNLVGESSDRARILKVFADRYSECNPTLFDSPDAIHALSCALLLLNTDLHGNITSKKMSMHEFIDNLAFTGFIFDRGLLKTLYAKVKNQPFKSHEPPAPTTTKQTKRSSNANSIMANQFVKQITDQVDYFHGWIMVKEVYDRDGKKTPFGRRQWRMFFGTVRGLVLYLHKNERGFEGSRFEVFQNCIRLHHALAEIPRDYTKKSHVFRITTAKLGEYLVQTSSNEELIKWVNAVNFVAASLSSPALPEAASSRFAGAQLKLSPLPSAASTLSIREQLQKHREKMAEINDLLTILRETAPSLKAKGKPVYEYFYRERFLERELLRYKSYADTISHNLSPTSRPESRNNLNSIAATASLSLQHQ